MSGSGVAPVADGSPSSTASHQAAQELVVLGHGIGSTSRLEVTTADIRRCAGRVRTVAERVRAAAATARLAAAGVSATAHLTTGVGGAAAGAAWLAVGQAERQVGELLDLAARMEATADRYDAAEARAASTVWRITRPPLRLPLLLPWAHVGIAWGLVARDAMLHGQVLPTRHGVGMGLRETIWAFTGIDRGVPAVGRVLAGAVDVWVDHDVEVRQVDPVTASGGDAPVSDLAGVVTAIEDLYPDNGHVEPGTIRIDRVTGADGAVSWLVLLPGTQGSLVADHGFDWSSNPGAMLGATTASTAVVVQAMRLAGIRPGQPVMIAGHSQGGLVAVNAANAVAEEVDVAGVLTLGAPTGLLDAPSGAEVLSIEHVEDPVPGLDDAPNPVGDAWTTVERTLSGTTDPDVPDLGAFGTSHDTPAYLDTARLVDASDAAALDGFFSGVEQVLDPDATVESTYYQGSRAS